MDCPTKESSNLFRAEDRTINDGAGAVATPASPTGELEREWNGAITAVDPFFPSSLFHLKAFTLNTSFFAMCLSPTTRNVVTQ